MSDKKPDQVVFDEDSNRYDASLKPYATNVGAPAIQLNETVAWKRSNVKRANEHFKAEFDELRAAYDRMVDRIEMNELVYSASFNFEPIVGEVYHLYRKKDAQTFLSIVAPDECNFDHIGSFRLTADKLWEAIVIAEEA